MQAEEIVQWIGGALLAITWLSTMLPNAHRNPILNTLFRVANILSANVGQNRNRE